MPDDEALIRRDEVVRIHLDRLEQLLRSRQPIASEAIQASMSLRFLFDGALDQVAHMHGHPLSVSAPDTDSVPLDQALFFACGGYILGGVTIQPHYGYREPGLHSPHRPQFERQVAASPRIHTFKEVRLGRFRTLPCLSFLGKFSLGRPLFVMSPTSAAAPIMLTIPRSSSRLIGS